MELLHLLLDGRQSSVAEHLQALPHTILSKNDMVDKVGYLINFLVERCNCVEKRFDFLVMFAVMIVIWIFLLTRLVFVGSF